MNSKVKRALRLAGVVALFWSGAMGLARADEMSLTMGTFKGSLISFPAQVAQKLGIFKKHGLNVTFVNFGNCPDMINALQSGGIDTVACPASLIMTDNAKGFDLAVVTDNIAAQEYTLIARKGLARPNASKPYPANILDLKGKTVGVPVFGSDAQNVVKFFLKRAGLNPETDVTWISVGGPLTAIAAFKGHRVDYLSAWEPEQTVLVNMEKLADVVVDTRDGTGSPLFQKYISNMTEAKRSELKKNPEKFKRLAAVWSETIAYMRDPSHFAQMVDIFASTSGLSKPTIEALLKDNLKYFDARIDCVALNNVIKYEVEIGDVASNKAPTCKQFVWSGSSGLLE